MVRPYEKDNTFMTPTHKTVDKIFSGASKQRKLISGTTDYKGIKGTRLVNAVKQLQDELLEDGNSRGILSLARAGDSGHAISYEVYKGNVYFIDNQIGKVMVGLNQFHEYCKQQSVTPMIGYTRTDNLKISGEDLHMPWIDPGKEIIKKKDIFSERPSTLVTVAAGEVAGITALNVYCRSVNKSKIVSAYKSGMTKQEIADKYDVSLTTVNRMVNS